MSSSPSTGNLIFNCFGEHLLKVLPQIILKTINVSFIAQVIQVHVFKLLPLKLDNLCQYQLTEMIFLHNWCAQLNRIYNSIDEYFNYWVPWCNRKILYFSYMKWVTKCPQTRIQNDKSPRNKFDIHWYDIIWYILKLKF